MFPFQGSCPFLDVQKILCFHGFVRYFNDISEKFRMAQFYCWLRTEAVLCHIKLTLDFHYTIAINFCVDMLKNHQKITVVIFEFHYQVFIAIFRFCAFLCMRLACQSRVDANTAAVSTYLLNDHLHCFL